MPISRKLTVWGPDKIDSGEYEVRWRVYLTGPKGRDRRLRFPKKGLADSFVDHLHKAHNSAEDLQTGRRWTWDDGLHPHLETVEERAADIRHPHGRRHRRPALRHEEEGEPIWTIITDWRKSTWHLQSPNGRKSAAFALRAMARWLVHDQDEPTPESALAYLEAIAFRQVEEPSLAQLTEQYKDKFEYRSGRRIVVGTVSEVWEGRQWLEANSLPVTALTVEHLQNLFVKMCGGRKANTERRYWTNVKTVLQWASEKKRLDPELVDAVVVRGREATSVEDVGATPTEYEMWVFAWACGDVGGERSKGRWCALPLVMGGAGLRIGECMALVRGSISEDKATGGMWIRVRRNRTTPGCDWTDDGERIDTRGTKQRGARGNTKGRTTYLPPREAAVFRLHLELFVGRGPNAPVFTGPEGSIPDYGRLDRVVIKPAAAKAFPEPHRLAGITPHAFRHLAATRWLRSGMALTAAARWGGWKQVSTMVDFYDSVLPNDDNAAARCMQSPGSQGPHPLH